MSHRACDLSELNPLVPALILFPGVPLPVQFRGKGPHVVDPLLPEITRIKTENHCLELAKPIQLRKVQVLVRSFLYRNHMHCKPQKPNN